VQKSGFETFLTATWRRFIVQILSSDVDEIFNCNSFWTQLLDGFKSLLG